MMKVLLAAVVRSPGIRLGSRSFCDNPFRKRGEAKPKHPKHDEALSLMMKLAMCPTQQEFLNQHAPEIVPDGNGALYFAEHHALTGNRSIDLLEIRGDVLALLGEVESEGDEINQGMVGVSTNAVPTDHDGSLTGQLPKL